MAKIAASLNEAIPDEAVIIGRLPIKGLSAFIKEALKLYIRFLDGEIVCISPDDLDALKSATPHPSQAAPVAVAPDPQLRQVIENNTQAMRDLTAVLQGGMVSLSTNGNGHHNYEPEMDTEDPDDPLVQAFAGFSAAEQQW
jgi:hypothetical protein